jgi:hypothetical protein
MEDMPTARRTVLVALALAAPATAAAGCGGTHARPRAASTPPATTAPPRAPAPGLDPHVLPPKRVPTHPTGAADPAARRVIEHWVAALRHGHLARAASYFAVPSRFQNGTRVLTLDTEREVLAVNVGFPCGAVATHYAASGAFTLVRFRLTTRIGGDCHGAEGNTTGGAIRVVRGHIREWYRLYDPEEIRPPGPLVDPGTQKA